MTQTPVLPSKPRVFVAPQPDVYGFARMLQIHRETEGYVTGVVRTMDEAFSLLNLESPEFHPLTGLPENSEQPAS